MFRLSSLLRLVEYPGGNAPNPKIQFTLPQVSAVSWCCKPHWSFMPFGTTRLVMFRPLQGETTRLTTGLLLLTVVAIEAAQP